MTEDVDRISKYQQQPQRSTFKQNVRNIWL